MIVVTLTGINIENSILEAETNHAINATINNNNEKYNHGLRILANIFPSYFIEIIFKLPTQLLLI